MKGKLVSWGSLFDLIRLWKSCISSRKNSLFRRNIINCFSTSRLLTFVYSTAFYGCDAFFCAAEMFPQSKIALTWIGYTNLLEPARWWRYLFGAGFKLQRGVTFQNSEYKNLLYAEELNFFRSLTSK